MNTDKFEYRQEIIEFRQSSEPARYPGTRDNSDVYYQLAMYLNELGATGWEAIPLIDTIYVKNEYVVVLTLKTFLKKRIYSTASEIERLVHQYSTEYATTLRSDFMHRVDTLAWTDFGKHFKQEIVDEMLNQISELIEKNNEIIVSKIKSL